MKDIPVPGDKLTYADLTLSFFVDEDLENYIEVHNWLRGLGFPESIQEFIDLKKRDPYNDDSDARTQRMNIRMQVFLFTIATIMK